MSGQRNCATFIRFSLYDNLNLRRFPYSSFCYSIPESNMIYNVQCLKNQHNIYNLTIRDCYCFNFRFFIFCLNLDFTYNFANVYSKNWVQSIQFLTCWLQKWKNLDRGSRKKQSKWACLIGVILQEKQDFLCIRVELNSGHFLYKSFSCSIFHSNVI